MGNNELLKRAEDLRARAEKSGAVTHTNFLSPAESYEIALWAKNRADCSLLLSGGHELCERKLAFFLPYYMEAEYFPLEDYIRAIFLKAHFGTPGHRDYMGALLGMGIGREWLGDIWVDGESAVVFCLPGVQQHLLSIEKAGRISVTGSPLALEAVIAPERNVKPVSFSVMSPRLDAVTAGLFSLSRTEAARHIAAGDVTLNYVQCFKADMPVKEGDVLSLRGSGKGKIGARGGQSRKGRTFLNAELYK